MESKTPKRIIHKKTKRLLPNKQQPNKEVPSRVELLSTVLQTVT